MSYDLPKWMQADAPSEPFKAFLAGAQTGTAIKENQIRAAQLAEEQRQFDAVQQLRARAAQQTFELNRIHLEDQIRAQRDHIDAERAYKEVASLWSRHQALGIAGTPGSDAAIGYKIANNGNFWLHPGAKDLAADVALAGKVRDVAQQREADAAESLLRVQTQQAAQTDRAYDRRAHQTELENLKHQHRIELAQERTRPIAEKLSDNDRLAMASELREANSLTPEEAGPMIEHINAKYDAIRQGKPPPVVDTQREALEQEVRKLDEDIARKRIGLAKNPQKPLLDFGEDNRLGEIRDLEKKKAAVQMLLTQKPARGDTSAAALDTQPDRGSMLNKPIFRNGPSDMVPVITPDGRRGMMPRANLEKALQAGYKEAR